MEHYDTLKDRHVRKHHALPQQKNMKHTSMTLRGMGTLAFLQEKTSFVTSCLLVWVTLGPFLKTKIVLTEKYSCNS